MIAGLAQRNWIVYTTAMDTKFKKGMTPWNKGKIGYMGANRTSFKKGHGYIPLKERFEVKVFKGEKCWLWVGSKNNTGYGRINVKGKIELAHRIAYQFKYGLIPEGMSIMHDCDNPICVNPAHLKLGTHLDNMKDMYFKGRACLNENRTQAKLDWEKVREIRRLYSLGGCTHRSLAKIYKVSSPIVTDIINHKRWIE